MASNNGSRGLFAGADIFKPNQKSDEKTDAFRPDQAEKGLGNEPGGPRFSSSVPVVSTGRSVTQNAASGARNMGKGRNGTPKTV